MHIKTIHVLTSLKLFKVQKNFISWNKYILFPINYIALQEFLLLVFVLVPHPAMLRIYSCLYSKKTLSRLREPDVVLEIKPGSAVHRQKKKNGLILNILSLWFTTEYFLLYYTGIY